MSVTILPARRPIDARITIPGSKSITNRALLLAALAQGESFLENILWSDDTFALITSLRELGIFLEINEVKSTVRVLGCSGQFPSSKARIHCRDAGTVARFLLAVCATQVGEFHFEGSKRLSERPLSELVHVLRKQGASLSSESFPLILKNKLVMRGGKIFISGQVSSQFLSGLLIAAPYCENDVILRTKSLVSAPYVNMTCAMMRDFGVEVIQNKTNWKVAVDKKYHARDYCIESDFSSASYFFAAAAVTSGKITLLNMNRENTLQGDVKFLDILEKMGCIIESEAHSITVIGPSQLKGVEVDMHAISDTMMTLAAIAPFADSPTRIYNVVNTRVKESDRISAMATNLRRLNVRVEEEADGLTIYPGTPLSGVIDAYRDHRIAMACSLIGLKVPGIVIDDERCVDKTFPGFFAVMQKIVS